MVLLEESDDADLLSNESHKTFTITMVYLPMNMKDKKISYYCFIFYVDFHFCRFLKLILKSTTELSEITQMKVI